VKQDPDQTFDPSDTGAGGAVAHTFNLSNVGVFRVAIPPDAVDDAEADLDVYNPAGEQVASSTLGGTGEEVTIQDPADGTWTVYVHGWQAPGGDTNCTLYRWSVSNASGGNLTVDSAPTSATIGEKDRSGSAGREPRTASGTSVRSRTTRVRRSSAARSWR